MGPADTTQVQAECDLRVGGRYHFKLITPTDEHNVSGVYREITPDEKLSFTWAWKSTPERESLVTLTFKDDDRGTIMTLLHEQFFDEAARDNHRTGWTGTMDRLEKYLTA
jgi:uncharacterized protein YndB with AHSA1/START domain